MTAGAGPHRVGGGTLLVPAGWTVLPDQGAQRLVALEQSRSAAVLPGQGGGPDGEARASVLFRASLVLTVDDNGTLSFRDWQVGTDELLPRQLAAYQLIDLERRPVGGHPGGRRLAQHVVDGVTPVTMEQWFAQVGTLAYTLTFTVDTWRYDAMADDVAELVDALVLTADTGPGDGA